MWVRILAGGSMALGGAVFVGLLIFGPDLPSYLVTSAASIRDTMNESVPLEFELQRARDMLDQMMPEIHAKIRVVAHEEVEVRSLRNQIRRNQQQLDRHAQRLQALRQSLETRPVSIHSPSGPDRDDRLRRLHQSFDQYKESEGLLASQRELLRARELSLLAARDALEDFRSQKALIEQRIESLAARHQLVEVRSTLRPQSNESGGLAPIDELLNEVDERIEVASRILDHETELSPVEPMASIDETDLLAEVDRYLRLPIGTADSDAVEVAESDDACQRVVD